MDIKEAKEILKQEPDFSLSYYKRENAIDVLLNELDKKDKEIEELKQDNAKQWEERCRLTFELQNLEEKIEYLEKEDKVVRIFKENMPEDTEIVVITKENYEKNFKEED